MTTQVFFGRKYFPAYSFKIGSDTLTTTAGYYYLSSYSTDTTNGFMQHMQALIKTIGAQNDAATTVSFSSATLGHTVITLKQSATLEFVTSGFKTLLGFTESTYTTATSFTSEATPYYKWMPSRSMSNFPMQAKASNFWVPKSNQVIGRSIDGTIFTVPMATLYSAEIEYFCLPQADVLTPTTGTTYREFQQFYTDIILTGNKFAFFPDWTDVTSTGCLFCILGKDGEDILGAFTQYESRHIKSYNSLFNMKIPLLKVV